MDIPLEYFSGGNLAHSSSEVYEECHLPDNSFPVHGGLFPPPSGIKRVLIPSVVSSLKSLEDHLLQLIKFA
jgi:uncharacterized protein (UPF0303 family)